MFANVKFALLTNNGCNFQLQLHTDSEDSDEILFINITEQANSSNKVTDCTDVYATSKSETGKR